MQLYWLKYTNYYNFTSAALHAPMVQTSHNSAAILSDFFKLSYNDKRNRKGNGKNYSNVKKSPKRGMTKKEREDEIKKLTE